MTLSVIVLFRVLAASQVVLTLIGVLGSSNPMRVKAVLACLGLGALSYFVEPLLQAEPILPVLAILSNAIPIFLWATCRIFFNDDTTLPRPAVVIGAATFGLIIVGAFRPAPSSAFSDIDFVIFRLLPQVLKLGFVIFAIRTALTGREVDLVEPRRRARRWFALGLGLMVAIVIATEIVTVFEVPTWLERVGMVVMFALTVVLNLLLFKPNEAFELRAPPAPIETPAPAFDDPLLIELQRLMADERVYAEHDLRIASLAERLSIPEHKLRRTINGKLGYRNFNQYVNGYRIDEAARRLLSEPGLPVLSIALDVGFRSLSAFNQAFRTAQGCTPTEHRAGSNHPS
ncbi:MAG: AraC family transcriptional regulator [Gammaproteobacteria bacterium]|nr:AraC family transcriptional regulator [Gammaproteobacteria bacterium]